ncbi:MAG: 30S ribosomal protein S20 [Lentisphaerae bacterium]|nr:30S ribosomal protein S20 [Lentisphaerota bacterium]
MPTTKSATKHLKTSLGKRTANRATKTRILSIRKKLHAAITEGDKAAAEKLSREYCSALDKAAKKGSIKANNASRNKSRITRRMATAGVLK